MQYHVDTRLSHTGSHWGTSSFLHKSRPACRCIDPGQRWMQSPKILWGKSDIFFKYISTEQLFLKLHETGHQGSTPLISHPMIFFF